MNYNFPVFVMVLGYSQAMYVEFTKRYAENRLDKRLRVYIRPKILIIDEVGYLPLDSLAANLFFQVVSARYERGSILMTSNKSFGEWGELMGDPILATAILDRLLHHSHVVNIRGNSYLLKEKMRTGIYGTPQRMWVNYIPALTINNPASFPTRTFWPGNWI
jgi:hypothetical protein